jgi:flagellar hook-associated protein 1 FlgK
MAGISTFFGIQTALRGLLAQQRGLDVTGHNVANANTAGYSRQEAALGASMALELEAGGIQSGGVAQLGSGVDVQQYRRIRDVFLDIQYRAQATRVGDETQTAKSLDQAELAFAEPGENGIADRLSKLWSAFGGLINTPDSAAARQSVVEQARSLATAFASLDSQLATVGTQAGAEYAALTGPTGDVQSFANQIASLNQAISAAVGSGGQPNDLMDRRDQLLDQLAELGQVSVQDLGTGAIRVSFGDAAVPLVDDTTVTWPQALTAPGGKLGALIDLSAPGGMIDAYRTDLNTAARTLADTINSIHNGGSGVDFFTYVPGSEAATLTVAVSAAGVRAGTGSAPGENDIAVAISRLRGGTADQAYQTLVGRVGNDVRESKRQQAAAEALRDAVQDRRDSTSGVSLDEEMTNLMRFQRAYQASARALSTLDEALDVLINRTGRVGL